MSVDPILFFEKKHRFLSNFAPAAVVLDGQTYPTVEHAYQAAKFPSDSPRRRAVGLAPYAAAAKRQARALWMNDAERKQWDQRKLGVMRQLLDQKFANPVLAEALLATGDRELIEGNWWGDTFWGVCRGEGKNHLGKMLMEIRAEIRTQGLQASER